MGGLTSTDPEDVVGATTVAISSLTVGGVVEVWAWLAGSVVVVVVGFEKYETIFACFTSGPSPNTMIKSSGQPRQSTRIA